MVDINKHLSHKQRKGLDGGGTILCLWEDELATHPWLHRSLAKLPTGSIPPSFVKHSGTFWVSLPLMITLYARQQKRHRCIEQSPRTLWERVRVEWFGRMALKHVYYHMWKELPVQVWCMIQDAWDWCTGMTHRVGMGRDVGGGFRMGNTCIPLADSCHCMAKPIQYFKVISLQINKFIFKKRLL